jgi:DNA (cytosine-5)-methyltransferase 1
MKVAGLFAGIGGVELGLSRAGHESVLLCENDPAAQAVLRHRWPETPLLGDVRTLRKLPSGTELLTAGFPCQDLSQAGQTKGITGKNSGLVSEVFRLLSKCEVPNVLLENVPFILALNKGEAMGILTRQFERLGYKWAYRVVDSRSFDLPQRRQRFFLFASKQFVPEQLLFADDDPPEEERRWSGRACGFYWTEGVRGLGWAVDATPPLKGGSTIGIPSPPAIWLPSGDVVTPDIRDAERLQGFPANWTRPATKVTRESTRWKLVGNAVSVPVAKWFGGLLAGKQKQLPLNTSYFERTKKWPDASFGSMGNEPQRVYVSMFPKKPKYTPLADFLRFQPKPLSYRATAGFISRLASGNLHFPQEFLEALTLHREKMSAKERRAA